MSEKVLPATVHGHSPGNHQVAFERSADIHGYVEKVLVCLEAAADEKNGACVRGGYLRQADEYLDAVSRFARCAKEQLRLAYCSQ